MSGRKERYNDAAYAEVIQLIGEGVPLSNALGGKDKPGRTAFFERLKNDAALAREYEFAMQQRAQCRVDAILDINARLLEGRIDPASAKVASSNLIWLAGKEDRARFGEVSRAGITGKDGAPLLADPQMSDFETARLIAYLMNKGARHGPIDGGELHALPSPEASHTLST